VKLTVEEVLARIEAHMSAKVDEQLSGTVAEPLELENVQVAPLSLEGGQESLSKCLGLLARLVRYDITTLVAEQVFPAFAQSILYTFDHFAEVKDSERFRPVVEVGSKLFWAYHMSSGGHSELAYQLAEELRESPSWYQPNWLNEIISKFQAKEFTKLSVETLTHMAQHSLQFQQGIENDDLANQTVVFGKGRETLKNYQCHTNTFLSALLHSTVEANFPELSVEITMATSEIKALAEQLLRFKGLRIKLTGVAVDYLLVGELIGAFHQAHAATDNLDDQERYAQACAVLVDMVVMELDDPKQDAGAIFRQRPGGVARIEEKAFTTLLRGFERTTDAPLASPFKELMDRYRRVVVGSALHSQATFAEHLLSTMVAEQVISRMFVHCKDDLRDPSFLKFIGKPGRLNVVGRISSFNDPAFHREFLKNNKELRGASLESELGL
jgi:hypothetical protein